MSVLSCLAALILGAAPALADDKEALAQAVAKLAEVDSYSFKGETEFQSQFGNAPPTMPTLDGKYQKDTGLYIKSDKGELFRRGDRVLVMRAGGIAVELEAARTTQAEVLAHALGQAS